MSPREPSNPSPVDQRAVAYLRSSKDRSDVSIDAQRRALHELAAGRGLVVVEEFADAVESGKDEDRPAFQRLYAALRAATRPWSTILVLDTSRIARRRLISLIFEQECTKRGIRIVYKSIPEGDPTTDMLIRSVLQAFDEYHSLISRAKGLAGMSENVRQGWRAGGRAPRGYRLDYTATGAVRDGAPVLKSRLVPSDEAPVVQAYLQARAAGRMRRQIMVAIGVDWPIASLNGMEWQAMTYAGHTVWNVHAERAGGASLSGTRRRPRSDWIIKRDTHEPLITDDEAEAILDRAARQRERHIRQDARAYLLAGLMQTPDGRAWAGDSGGFYRVGKARRVASKRVEAAVLDRIFESLNDDATVQWLVMHVRNQAAAPVDGRSIAALDRRAVSLGAQIAKTVDMAAQLADPTPILRRVTDLEAERQAVSDQAAAMRRRRDEQQAAVDVTPDDIRAALAGLRAGLDQAEGVAETRDALAETIERIELDPQTLRFAIHMRLAGSEGGVSMASRRVAELSPPRWVVSGVVPGKRATG
jgi:site-specific DNA recombinase